MSNRVIAQNYRKKLIASLTGNCECFKGSKEALNKLSDQRLKTLAANFLVTNSPHDDAPRTSITKPAVKNKRNTKNADPDDDLTMLLDWVSAAPGKIKEGMVSKIKAALGLDEDEPMPSPEDPADNEDPMDLEENEEEEDEEEIAENEVIPEGGDEQPKKQDPPGDSALNLDEVMEDKPKNKTTNKRAPVATTLRNELKKLHPTVRRVVNSAILADREERKGIIAKILKTVSNAEDKKALFEDIKTFDAPALRRFLTITNQSGNRRPRIYGDDMSIKIEQANNEGDVDGPVMPTLDWAEMSKNSRN